MSPHPEHLTAADVSRETLGRLKHFEVLLRKWNPKINLVSKSTLEDAWGRHIEDSLQIFSLGSGNSWLDLGAGGGFPGCVVAILANEFAPSMTTTMIESDQRKAVFLRTVLRETGVAGKVISERIEQADPCGADVISARALADLTALMGFYERHIGEGGQALFMKGQSWKEELAAAEQVWKFDYEAIKSKTQPDAVILRITGAKRA